MSPQARLVGVSDVSLGYGSPQIPAFMRSLRDYYGDAEAIVIEPAQPELPPRHELYPDLRIERVETSLHPHGPGRVEYIWVTARLVDSLQPHLLVVFCSYSLPVIFKLRRRPPFTIYYQTEFAPAYGRLDVEMNRQIGTLVDLVIFPEENRAVRDIQVCGYRDLPMVLLYNCVNSQKDRPPLEPEARNGRVIYQGTIEEGRTFAEYYLDPRVRDIPIDLYGPIRGHRGEETANAFRRLMGAVRYGGVLDRQALSEVRRTYAFSVVAWNPLNENLLYACPNKFFESVADGVPPIVAPHPQLKNLVRQYDCGIVMADWSFDAFYKSLVKALAIYGTPRYARMVRNCQRAVAAELNWEAQFAKVAAWLPAYGREGGNRR